MRVKIPHARGNFEGQGAAHCKVYGLAAVSYAKKAEPTDLQFGLWTQVGPRTTTITSV